MLALSPRFSCSTGLVLRSLLFCWMATGLGISMGYHRLHTVDGLYHELQFKTAVQFGQTPPDWGRAFHQHVVTWEFPFLLKYRFKLPLVKPFIAAGPACRVLGNLSHTNPSNHGIAAGLGFEAHLWKLNIAPQFRYLRWARDQNVEMFGLTTVTDQVQFLTAITFPRPSRNR